MHLEHNIVQLNVEVWICNYDKTEVTRSKLIEPQLPLSYLANPLSTSKWYFIIKAQLVIYLRR